MLAWLSSDTAPAWMQAIGSVIAIFVAVWIPARQRSNSLRDAHAERAQQLKDFRQRLTIGLKSEISAALEAANRRQSAVERTLQGLQEARTRGAVIADSGPIQPGSLVMTDAIVYRQMAAELGKLPPELIKSVVLFYSMALDLGRMADALRLRRRPTRLSKVSLRDSK